jgi:hypothetical protein
MLLSIMLSSCSSYILQPIILRPLEILLLLMSILLHLLVVVLSVLLILLLVLLLPPPLPPDPQVCHVGKRGDRAALLDSTVARCA